MKDDALVWVQYWPRTNRLMVELTGGRVFWFDDISDETYSACRTDVQHRARYGQGNILLPTRKDSSWAWANKYK